MPFRVIKHRTRKLFRNKSKGTHKHTINIKPQQLIKNGNKNSQKNICSKNYESRSGLWRHEKKCKLISPIKPLLLNSEEKCKTM